MLTPILESKSWQAQLKRRMPVGINLVHGKWKIYMARTASTASCSACFYIVQWEHSGNIKSTVLPFNNNINYCVHCRFQTIIFMQSLFMLPSTRCCLWHPCAWKPQHPEHTHHSVAPYTMKKCFVVVLNPFEHIYLGYEGCRSRIGVMSY